MICLEKACSDPGYEQYLLWVGVVAFLSLTHLHVPAAAGSAFAQMQPGQMRCPLPSSSKSLEGGGGPTWMCPCCCAQSVGSAPGRWQFLPSAVPPYKPEAESSALFSGPSLILLPCKLFPLSLIIIMRADYSEKYCCLVSDLCFCPSLTRSF